MTHNQNLTPDQKEEVVEDTELPKENYFAYGDSNFTNIKNNASFLVDTTDAIVKLLWNKHMVLYKPQRHGKSLFLNILLKLLDKNISEEEFQKLFGDLSIYKNKDAKEHFSQYHVLEFNFNLPKDDGGYGDIRQKFYNKLISSLEDFCEKYGLDKSKINNNDPILSIGDVCKQVAKKKGNLIIIVDEYDRFANRLFLEPFEDGKDTLPDEAVKSYHEVVAGKSSVKGSSLLRSFLEKLKELDTADFGKYKTIIAGILPIDASGANEIKDISHFPIIVDSFGFKEEDLERALKEIGTSEEDRNKALKIMRTFYNGYNFYRSKKLLYNPQLCLKFLDKFHVDSEFKKMVLSWDVNNLKNLVEEEKDQLNDENAHVSRGFLSFLSLKGFQTKSVISALVWCREQATIVGSKTIDGSNTEGERIVYGIRCLKSEKGWGVHYSASTEKKIRLNELLQSKEDIGLKNILFMMYTYGLITYSDFNKSTLCITNEMMFDHFTEKFNQYLQPSTPGALSSFLSAKESSFLKKLLQSILESTTTPKDNSMTEGAIQLGFEIALQNHLSQAQFNYSIKGSSPSQNKESNSKDFEKKLDLKIEFQDSIFAIEFKRARPNSIQVVGKDSRVIRGKYNAELKKYDWLDTHFSEQQEILDNMKEDNLTTIPFMAYAPEKKYGLDGKKLERRELCTTLGDLLDSAINQLTGYIKALKQHESQIQEKKVYAFAVIHAAQNTFLVKEHSFNGKQLKDIN